MTTFLVIIAIACFVGAGIYWFIRRVNRLMGLALPPIHGENE